MPPALHREESGLSAAGRAVRPQMHRYWFSCQEGGSPLKKSPMGGQGPSSSWVCSSVEKPGVAGAAQGGHCPSPLPGRACCCHSVRPHLPQPHSPRSRVPLPPAWTPQKACGHLCLWQPVRGQVHPRGVSQGSSFWVPWLGRAQPPELRARALGQGRTHPPAGPGGWWAECHGCNALTRVSSRRSGDWNSRPRRCTSRPSPE